MNMFYASDPRSNHDYSAPSDQDKYSSIRVLDQTHKSICHNSVSGTNVLQNFSSQLTNKGQCEKVKPPRPRPFSTIEGSFSIVSNEAKSKSLNFNQSSKTGNKRNTDPFSDICHTVRQSIDLPVDASINSHSKGSSSSINSDFSSNSSLFSVNLEPASKSVAGVTLPPGIASVPQPEPEVLEFNSSVVEGEVSCLRSQSRVSSPRYHALSEDELEEELREEDEVRSRNDSVVLRHEMIRSCSISENLAQKTNEHDPKLPEIDEVDSRKGYVQLSFDACGVLWEDNFQQPISPSKDKPNQMTKDEKQPLPAMMAPNDLTIVNDYYSVPRRHENAPITIPSHTSANDQNGSSTPPDASKRLTVDIGELHRKSEGKSIPSRQKHTSIGSNNIREIKFLRSPPSRVSTLFSTKIPEIRSPEKQKGGQKGKQLIEPGFVFFGDGLFDFTEERNEEAVAFSTMVGELRSKLCGELDLNLGYLLSPAVTQNSHSLVENLEEVPLSLEVFIEGQQSPVLINCSSKTCVSHVVAKVLKTVWQQEVSSSSIMDGAFTLKVCGFQEYLNNSKLLCEYEYVHQCAMARHSVRLALLDSDLVPRTLARSEMDDITDCEPRIYSQFFDRPLDTSVSREGLNVLREAFEEELKRVVQDAGSQNPRFQPGRLIQSVRAVCTTLGQIETKGIVNNVYLLKEMKRRCDEAGSPTGNTIDMIGLRKVIQDLYKHVYLLIELYCNTFNTDFGRIRISEKMINGSIEVTAMTDKFSVYIPAAYRIPLDWKEKFESYIVEGKIYYGGQILSVPEYTVLGKICTNFFPHILWQCWMEFEIELRKLPRESKLCLTLYGLSPPPKNGTTASLRTSLGWTAVQLFDFNGLLVSGSQLFGLWPNQAANPLGTCTSNLIDKRSAILQVDFAHHLSDIVFPALKIPEAETGMPEAVPMELFNQLLSKDMFEDLRPDDVNMIWKNRLLASKVNNYTQIFLLVQTRI